LNSNRRYIPTVIILDKWN